MYDLFVIGGGAGGLASSKAAASLGKRVALADFTQPGPHATTWGTGGTCVNVGCIPTKLMPYAARLGELKKNQINAGFNANPTIRHDWTTLINCIQKHIQELNVKQEKSLEQHKITYYNKFARFLDKHTIELTDDQGVSQQITAETIIISVGSRPILYSDPKLVITSEDVFSQKTPPGKTLVVGASYVGLECAGFIHGFGYDTTVMVRSKIMRNFDQEMAGKVKEYMADSGVKFMMNTYPLSIEAEGSRKLVKWIQDENHKQDIFDSVLYAVGRKASTSKLNLDSIGVVVDPKNHKVLTDEYDRTSVDNIYAIGDCCQGRLEYTPIAVMGGRKLARRLYQGSQELMDYVDVATTIYTPIEYGCIGLSEEKAKEKYHDIDVYFSEFRPLSWSFNPKEYRCCAKLIVDQKSDRVIGFHYVGPEAAEVTQGFAVAIKMKATKSDFDETVAIHPSLAEEMVLMKHKRQ